MARTRSKHQNFSICGTINLHLPEQASRLSRLVSRIPPEVLARIFIDALRSYLPEVHEEDGIVCRPDVTISESSIISEDLEHKRIGTCLRLQESHLLSITYVSSKWRSTSIHYPVLWSNIYITLTTPSSLVKAWLQRSQGIPLNVVLDLRRQDGPTEPGKATLHLHLFIVWTMNALQSHIHRCKSISVGTSVDTDMQIILAKLYASPAAPLLEDLRLCQEEDNLDRETPVDDAVAGRIFAGVTPRLSKVRLSGIGLSSTIMRPLTNLTEISFRCTSGTSITWGELAVILALSPAVCRLTLWAVECDDIPSVTNTLAEARLDLLHLISMSLGYIETALATNLLSHIHAPNLQTLTLDFDDPDCDDIGDCLSSLSRGRPSILSTVIHLEVTGLSLSLLTASNMAEEMRGLQTLDLCDASSLFEGILHTSTIAFRTHTTPGNTASINYVCPNITAITISGTDALSISAFAMIRRCIGFTIPYLRVSRCDFGTGDRIAHITRFVGRLEFTAATRMF